MSDRDFILTNYDSCLEDVLLNRDPEFWSNITGAEGSDDGYMQDALAADVRAWRRRLEAAWREKHVKPHCTGTYDPDHTEEWWAAIDADTEYQKEQDR